VGSVSRAAGDLKVNFAAKLPRVAFDDSKVFLLRQHRFYHGNAVVDRHVLLFFYFHEADTGIAALIPGVRGAMEVARFRVTAALCDPRMN
jgi:hypothetical protein